MQSTVRYTVEYVMRLARVDHEAQKPNTTSSPGGSLLPDRLGSLTHSVAIAAAIDAICIQKHEPYRIYSYNSANKTHKKTNAKEANIHRPSPIPAASPPLCPSTFSSQGTRRAETGNPDEARHRWRVSPACVLHLPPTLVEPPLTPQHAVASAWRH